MGEYPTDEEYGGIFFILLEENKKGNTKLSKEYIENEAKKIGIDEKKFEYHLKKLWEDGIVYEPRKDIWGLTLNYDEIKKKTEEYKLKRKYERIDFNKVDKVMNKLGIDVDLNKLNNNREELDI